MGWEFEETGRFGSEKAADDYAKANNVDPRDIHVARRGDQVALSIRRSALDRRGLRDRNEGRRDSWS